MKIIVNNNLTWMILIVNKIILVRSVRKLKLNAGFFPQ